MLVVMLAETSACQRFRTMAAASLAVVGRKSSVAAMLPATAGLAVRLNTGQLGALYAPRPHVPLLCSALLWEASQSGVLCCLQHSATSAIFPAPQKGFG